jgi:hypothetical protein
MTVLGPIQSSALDPEPRRSFIPAIRLCLGRQPRQPITTSKPRFSACD